MRTVIFVAIFAAIVAITQISFVSQSSFLSTYTHLALLTSTLVTIFLNPKVSVPFVVLVGIFLDGVTTLPMGTMTIALSASTIIICFILKPLLRNKYILVLVTTVVGPSILTLVAWLFDKLFAWFGGAGTHLIMGQQLLHQLLSITSGNLVLSIIVLLVGKVSSEYISKRFIKVQSQ
ncbi:MAG: hypothetical protein A2898_04275 [Candidatus Kerfeldbacteria bacterium RIFCSPLOWO2_01_FULL_48_11]|uniref:Uncharacterized protein n=1 Tax=Candidatus Kerfeldbacteria bacterium RIFCSPLOWO2_01_FULL_48_11 TaxID=1798543 RepID=A0A1G2B0S0_9BACT|nr:MAG: hypothetical protein UY34_C0001G0059 [Parcubacteria group bacterium GW2011_GWA2_48_9]KKW16220.1 MAG: hypothetical protein UY52_C0008G0013 [Parcubacteria group bacterium GW2011_GWC2_49_9]OGY82783.1 MAG: hypothetical protein A2898_04275 [Candidatus Kerfeldbacteria bacterium RIFCSPLOWO2_01_FULL_48_11]HCJ52667.1 hypothetical protein [Candidatus Kerfeldbacteria bacterium]HCM67767.1 hypothetical protein [Candidatus Kerfeldbacteria bacterium]